MSRAARGRRWFWWLMGSLLLLQTAVYVVRPMVSYRALSVGAGATELGIITAAFAVLSLVVAVPIGRWIDRWGEPRFLVVGTVLIGSVGLSLIWIHSVPGLVVSQAMLGLGHIMGVAATQTLVANATAPERRDARFGVLTVVVSVAQLIGPALGGLVAGDGFSAAGAASGASEARIGTVFAVSGALGLLACLSTIAVWYVVPNRAVSAAAGEEPATTSWKAVGRVLTVPSLPQAMLASLTVVTSIDILVAYLPAYGEATGLSVTTVGFLLATRAAASLVSRLLMIPLISWLGRRWLLIWSMLLPAAMLGALTVLDAVVVLYVLMAIIGFGLGLGQPVTLAWIAARAPVGMRGTAIAVRLSGNRLGQTALPALVGGIGGTLGLVSVFWALAVLLALSTAAVWRASFPTD